MKHTDLIIPELSIYEAFYDNYSPKLWGVLVLAGLPLPATEKIFVNTLVRAWQQRTQHPLTQQHVLSYLIGIALNEGLPVESGQSLLMAHI